VTVGRRFVAGLEAAVSDPGAWPLGMLGFLVRGGLVVMALPILTLPSPVGLATLLGPAVISTGRLDGPLLVLIVGSSLALLAIVGLALVLAAIEQASLHGRWGRPAPMPPRTALGRLVALELVAIGPLAIVVALTLPTIVDEVRAELLLPGDLAVPLVVRVAARTLVPLAALVAAILVAEAIDGSLSRRVLVEQRRRRSPGRGLFSVIVTATFGWLATLIFLVPGLAVTSATWEAARVAWSGLASDPTSSEMVLASVATVAMVAVWIGVLWLCGIASILRAHLWSSRVGVAGDWTGVGH
jgi:hypothetical protein